MPRRHLSLILLVGFAVCGLGAHQNSPAPTHAASVESNILRALLREIVVPWRNGGRENPPPWIAVVTDSLQQCPPPPNVRGCLSADDLQRARADAGTSAWSSDLLRDLEDLNKKAVEFKDLDVSGFDRVVTMSFVQLRQTRPYPVPFAMTRPAVRDKTALVYIQFATGHTVFVVLTNKSGDWTVTKRVAYGAG